MAARDDRRRFISVAEAAVYLSAHEITIRDWISRGLIPSIRLGRAVRIDLRKLEAQISAQEEGRIRGGKGGA